MLLYSLNFWFASFSRSSCPSTSIVFEDLILSRKDSCCSLRLRLEWVFRRYRPAESLCWVCDFFIRGSPSGWIMCRRENMSFEGLILRAFLYTLFEAENFLLKFTLYPSISLLLTKSAFFTDLGRFIADLILLIFYSISDIFESGATLEISLKSCNDLGFSSSCLSIGTVSIFSCEKVLNC